MHLLNIVRSIASLQIRISKLPQKKNNDTVSATLHTDQSLDETVQLKLQNNNFNTTILCFPVWPIFLLGIVMLFYYQYAFIRLRNSGESLYTTRHRNNMYEGRTHTVRNTIGLPTNEHNSNFNIGSTVRGGSTPVSLLLWDVSPATILTPRN